jgi:hypothetical protein
LAAARRAIYSPGLFDLLVVVPVCPPVAAGPPVSPPELPLPEVAGLALSMLVFACESWPFDCCEYFFCMDCDCLFFESVEEDDAEALSAAMALPAAAAAQTSALAIRVEKDFMMRFAVVEH